MSISPVTIQSAPLRRWLPMMVVVAMVAIIGTFALIEVVEEYRAVDQQARRVVQLTASQIAPPCDAPWNRGVRTSCAPW